ncbi:serine hydrolase [Alicyclobacillus sp. SO9]|uniref:serine hydrolase domain-containing protein n=1 Tax=Alicyclobacillus sp. SO9 TaxID=2665646 RepID=UPI0018E7C27E|nr:serine hydrolase domain-containing protein [Alicyclobacillus sp. SO9]QQE79185.1 beta-lactamase family protein [Alicyclobacillus sp. SO9]
MQLIPVKLKRIDTFLQSEVDEGRLPGAVYAAGIGNNVVHEHAVGYAENRNGIQRPMNMDTMFDLASLTKVTATLPSILKLVDEGAFRLTDAVGLFLPEFAQGDKAAITIRHLLTHSSGLISHRNYYEIVSSREELLRLVRNESPDVKAGTRVVYSDLGFILLAEIIHTVTGQRIDEYARENVFHPLGMNETSYCPDETLRGRIAATEEFSNLGVKVGVVHDENTYTMGGVSGHAGLFAPLMDVVRYVQAWLSPDNPVLSQGIRKSAVRSYTEDLNGHRGLGWTCRWDGYDHTGDSWPQTTVGHTGFTGTSIAIDPVSKLWFVLLTNDVHYGRENKTIVRLRGRVHNMLSAAVMDEG